MYDVQLRTIFGGNKTAEEIKKQIDATPSNHNIMITRLEKETFDKIRWETQKITAPRAKSAMSCKGIPTLAYCESSNTGFIYRNSLQSNLSVAITSAGVADYNVVDEVGLTVMLSGYRPVFFDDIGVDNLEKTMKAVPKIKESNVVVSVQGFEGALPVVLAGLVDVPIIAVPTSTGYGVSADGYTALNTALTSCTSGISVVNIDNGFGGGAQAVRILKQVDSVLSNLGGQ